VAAAAAVLVAVNLTAILPVTPSNVGVFQAACIAALAPFGVAASRRLAYGILLQSVEVFCALSLGVPALLREGIPWEEVRGGWRGGSDQAVAAQVGGRVARDEVPPERVPSDHRANPKAHCSTVADLDR
jgi:hypothetical protein